MMAVVMIVMMIIVIKISLVALHLKEAQCFLFVKTGFFSGNNKIFIRRANWQQPEFKL